ncbi:MAG: DUF6160 family protein [Candidatus Macondimonas sp.]
MKLKSLSVLGLLAAAPMASQAAMVEMNETELSDVSGQAMFPGLLFNYSATYHWNPAYWNGTDFDVTTTPVLGGVQVNTSFSTNYEILPSWNVGITGKYSGTHYYTRSGSANWDPIDFSWSNTRTFLLK